MIKKYQFAQALGVVAFAASFLQPALAVNLSDAPIFSNTSVPGNLALALSVEYPTAISVANLGDYVHSTKYLGYFDPEKCYDYSYDKKNPDNSYFQPAGKASNHTCSGKWSGNFMNWVAMPTIDPFRWALTGGYRATDTESLTILQKAYGSAQGDAGSNYPYRGTKGSANNKLSASDVPKVTPFSGSNFSSRIWGKGVVMQFTTKDSSGYQNDSPSNLQHYGNGSTSKDENYSVRIRVKVCDSSSAAGGLEENCVKYGSNYKPEGLMQKFSNKIRYSAFGYLYEGGTNRQGGVLRAKMGFIGPEKPVPMSTNPEDNLNAEWSKSSGVMNSNPDSGLDSDVSNSGVMNYLNQFGNASEKYMSNDNVSEMYYAVMRYFQNIGNVPEWTNNTSGSNVGRKDSFPAPATWSDPILYSCQKNFVLGIGDSNTHYDKNTGGGSLVRTGRTKPPLVNADDFNKSDEWTKWVENKEGGDVATRNMAWGNDGSGYIAGLAYGNHVNDMRPDLVGKQTVNTYWMDVMEGQYAQDLNPYWLAAKYGGFNVPAGYDGTQAWKSEWWTTAGDTVPMYAKGKFSASNPNNNKQERQRPSNYFLAGNAAQMVDGLTQAFTSIAASVNAFTTAVTPSSNVFTSAGTTSYSASYGSENWSGSIKAATLSFGSDGSQLTDIWSSDTTMATQLAGSGWDTGRRVITWNKDHSSGARGVPFRLNSLSTTMKAALNTSYVANDDSASYLNYLRGDKANEVGTTTGTHTYRTRSAPLGDVVNSKLVLSSAPSMRYSEVYNKGYAAFKTAYASRTPLVLFGANDGMLHALNASTSGTSAGQEVFAYIPAQTYYGPDGSSATHANTNGLAAIGNPAYEHRYYVDATPQVFDIDFAKTYASGLSNPAWKTMVVGGLGKGGKGFYAMDITDPGAMSTEADAAGKVLWEISSSTTGFENLGYSFGVPVMVKTVKYGWTLILTSGYNNADGQGYLFLVNPRTGDLLETIGTGQAAPGLTHASAFIKNYMDGIADAVYVGDLNGKLWRFDLTKTTGSFDAPVVLFQTASPDGGAQPITSAPISEIHPSTRNRMVLFGTGKLLDGQDVSLTQRQSFYAVIDGNNTAFAAAPTSALTRSELTQVASLTTSVTIPKTSRGWYHDLPRDSGVAWRITITPAAADGIALFTATLTSGDACSPAGQGRAYAVDYASGESVLASKTNPSDTVAYLGMSSAPTDNVIVKKDGTLGGVAGDAGGKAQDLAFNKKASMIVRLINWRELKAVD
ncbi:pilus assembly protein [Comamonas fluminis]|uniref:pilus assembly protein n=1 Tax=Comamonas fluminis TaxID=2796366 RepID=UPI001C460438|nr:PilC/PilY family type IV pilus protein [Comamonas fluminis]